MYILYSGTVYIGYCLWRHCTEFFHTNPYWCHSTVKFAMAWFRCVCSHIINVLCVYTLYMCSCCWCCYLLIWLYFLLLFSSMVFFKTTQTSSAHLASSICMFLFAHACVYTKPWTCSSCHYHRAIYLAWFSLYYTVCNNHNKTWCRLYAMPYSWFLLEL